MFWLGLLLAVAYVPGYTGASVPTQWAVLSVILPLGLWRGTSTVGHKLFLAFIAYALLGLAWSINLYTAVWGLWVVFIWALSYHWGTLCEDLRPFWRGLAVGLFVSVGVAFAQTLDLAPVESSNSNPAGLFFNSALFGVILGLTLCGLLAHRLWWYMPPLALGIILSGSRGGIVIFAIGALARFGGLLAVGAAVVVGAVSLAAFYDPADAQRLQIWGVTLRALSAVGNGPGSFLDVYYVNHATLSLIRPEFVHNDYLQLAYEYGPGALALAGILGMALRQSSHPDWPVLIAFCVAACFFFPLYTPVTAFIGCCVAGSCLRLRSVDGVQRSGSRPNLISWCDRQETALHLT